ncbi:MAG TPA: hypothetical protein VG826_07735 [Pirellulales bacterium]|nr:hypothetical protein [Pirellulales bacterium]
MSRTIRPSRLFIILAGSHLAVGGTLTLLAREFYDDVELLIVLLVGLVVAQAGLVSLWAVFSADRRLFRWLGASSAGLLLIGELVTAGRSWHDATQIFWAVIWVLAPLFLVVLLALLLRRRNVRCTSPREIPIAASREGIQFSIAHILSLTFAVAVLLTVARALHGTNDLESVVSAALVAVLIGVLFAVQTISCLWATLGLGRWLWRLLLPLSLAAVGAGLLLYAGGDAADRFATLIGLTEGQTIVVIATLIAVRLAGYRLIRQPRNSAPSLAPGALSLSATTRI